ncbi:MAG: acyl-CoA thioesterase II [Rhizobiales bacterium 65-9]|nr:acyl-CoA thioesterase II [Hyphomicrobiales bacterium]OJY36578.1 MAG: acyl-CoA thioesterase II [Rhizobiales bacterium 65-9]
MAATIQELLDILALEPLEHNLFRGRSPQVGWQRVFGGLVIAQALVAAYRTVDGRPPHSLHAYFLLPGDPSVPIIYNVDRIRDGRSFTTRRVIAIQHGRAIFSLSASFQTVEGGLEHQIAMPDVPSPEEVPPLDALTTRLPEAAEGLAAHFSSKRPIEIRPIDIERYFSREQRPPLFNVWLRAREALPDDPMIHQCALAYASDMTLLDASLLPHGRSLIESSIAGASLDHALWFHRPFRADEWLLYSQDSPFSGGGRGFARGSLFTRDGTLVASVAQEGLIRIRVDRSR